MSTILARDVVGENNQPPVDLHGFPPGYFLIRSAASGRLLDVCLDKSNDGTPLILWPEKESSLVESFRKPDADNQVFFIDVSSGALCSKLAGHALDIQDDKLVIRHRQPQLKPYPSVRSHPLPTFTFDPKSGRLSVTFAVDPFFHSTDPGNPALSAVHALPGDTYIVTALPKHRAPGLVENIGSFWSHAKSKASGRSAPATRDEMFDANIDLREGEVVEGETDDAYEIDDDPDPAREVRLICVGNERVGTQTAYRRRWEIVPLREKKASTGTM